jgi:hypothetical protein
VREALNVSLGEGSEHVHVWEHVGSHSLVHFTLDVRKGATRLTRGSTTYDLS